MKRSALLLFLIFLPALSAADWISVSSTHFQILTSTAPYDARNTLTAFEQARDFFIREVPALAAAPPPTSVIGFESFDDYRPYSPGDAVLAYHMNQEEGDVIVISDLSLARTRIALHEYVHVLVNHSGLHIPLWLNEGMAEVYSTLQMQDGKLVLGKMNRDRLQSLTNQSWMRLPILLRIDEHSPEYREDDRGSMFYAESCLLAHMLMLGDQYAPKFAQFLEQVSASGSAQTAFTDVYGKPSSGIELDMKAYLRDHVSGGATYQSALAKVEIGDARPVSQVEAGVALANLLLHTGKTAEAKARLRQLAAAHPNDGDIEAAMVHIEEHGDTSQEDILAHYRSALAHHPALWLSYWRYARLLDESGAELDARIQALQNALQRNPKYFDARLRLAMDLCAASRFNEASQLLQPPNPVDQSFASATFRVLSEAAYGLRQLDQSRQLAQQAVDAARTATDRAAAQRLLSQLQSPNTNATESRPASDADPGRPVLRHTTPPPPPPPKKKGN